jgi:hypothetical protein
MAKTKFNELIQSAMHQLRPISSIEEAMQSLDLNLPDQKAIYNICKNDVASWGIASAIYQFNQATNGTEEEHRTSALMGFIAGAMGHYNLLAAVLKIKQNHTNFHWHAAHKKSSKTRPGEDKHGGDFGVAVALNESHYRVSFFQAKKAIENKYVDISHGPTKSKELSKAKTNLIKSHLDNEDLETAIDKLRLESENSIKMTSEASKRLHGWLQLNELAEFDFSKPNYQLYKIAATERLGNKIYESVGSKEVPWCHYVIWSSREPVCFSIQSLRSWVMENIDKPSATSNEGKSNDAENGQSDEKIPKAELVKRIKGIQFLYPDEDDGTSLKTNSFSHHLAHGIAPAENKEETDGWITIQKSEFESIIGELKDTGTIWYIATGNNSKPRLELSDEIEIVTLSISPTSTSKPTPTPPAASGKTQRLGRNN